jgi:hypothetical protein
MNWDVLSFEHQSYLSLCRDGLHRHDTRTVRWKQRTPIVETFEKARHGVGVSREPAKLGSQDDSPLKGKDNPPVTAADSAEHVRPTITS